MKFLSLFLLISLLGVETIYATPVQRLFQDVKLPTQKVIEVQSWSGPVGSDTVLMINAQTIPSAAAFSSTSIVSQPPYARTLVVNAGGSSVDLGNCTVTVSGLNINGHSISEDFVFTSGSLGTRTGLKAFKSVSSVSWPASCSVNGFATKWYVGTGIAFGLKRCMSNAGDIFRELLDGANATAGTAAASASAVESNTWVPNTTPNGVHNYIDYFVQNYQCF